MSKSVELDWDVDAGVLPGIRFHPTDEELVNFYLRKKVEQKRLASEPIMELDIYKFDPWDLPKLSQLAESQHELYFYCPRNRKYRNSDKPSRVTASGFWKATGTDRPICSLDGTKCIGLKKSLVFYKGKAAKAMKTDWMMHEFRLPYTSDQYWAKQIAQQTTDSDWAVCRIFMKKNRSSQMIAPLPLRLSSAVKRKLCVTDLTAHHPASTILNRRYADNEAELSNQESTLPAESPITRAEMSAVKSACQYLINNCKPDPKAMADCVFSSYKLESTIALSAGSVTEGTCLEEEYPPLEEEGMGSLRYMIMSPAISEFPLEEIDSNLPHMNSALHLLHPSSPYFLL